MIGPAFGLWLATWWPWACSLPDPTGFPCGIRGWGAASQQQHAANHRAGPVGRYVCNACHKRHDTAAADRCGR